MRQRHSAREPLGRCFVEPVLLSHDDLKPSLAVLDDAEHLLVGAPCEEGLVDVDWTARLFGLTADAVDAAGTLLEDAGVPIEVVVDDVPAESMEVHALAQDPAGDENLGEDSDC